MYLEDVDKRDLIRNSSVNLERAWLVYLDLSFRASGV